MVYIPPLDISDFKTRTVESQQREVQESLKRAARAREIVNRGKTTALEAPSSSRSASPAHSDASRYADSFISASERTTKTFSPHTAETTAESPKIESAKEKRARQIEELRDSIKPVDDIIKKRSISAEENAKKKTKSDR